MNTDINSVVLVGRLTRDADLKYIASGVPVSRLGLAVNRKKKVNGQWVEEVNFFDIIIWGRVAEGLQQYLTKGKQISVQGELRQNRWEKDGKTNSRVEVIAITVQLLGGGNNQTQDAPQSGQNRQSKPPVNPNPQVDNFEDDIPF